MTAAKKITAAITLLEKSGYRVIQPTATGFRRAAPRSAGRPKGTGRRIDRDRVQSLARQGMTASQIAVECGCAISTVRSILNGTR